MFARDSDKPPSRPVDAVPSKPDDDGCSSPTGSGLLRELLDRAPKGHFTLQWLMSSLSKQSYAAVIFLLATLAVLPGISLPAGLLLLVPTLQLIAGRPAPRFPHWIAKRPLPTDKLTASLQRAIPTLELVERAVFPRWPAARAAGRRMVGWEVLLLTVRLLAWPLPLSNVIPAALISLIALSDLEGDGLMLALALAAGLVLLVVDARVLYVLLENVIPRILDAS